MKDIIEEVRVVAVGLLAVAVLVAVCVYDAEAPKIEYNMKHSLDYEQ